VRVFACAFVRACVRAGVDDKSLRMHLCACIYGFVCMRMYHMYAHASHVCACITCMRMHRMYAHVRYAHACEVCAYIISTQSVGVCCAYASYLCGVLQCVAVCCSVLQCA